MTIALALSEFCREWEQLNQKAGLGLAGHSAVSEFLRRWTLKASHWPPEECSLLLSSINTACQSLLAQVNYIAELARQGKQDSRLEAQGQERAEDLVTRDRASRQEEERRRQQKAQEEAKEKLRQTNREIERIHQETSDMLEDAAARRHHLNRVLANPELHCSRCHQAFLDPTRGCPHCLVPRSPII